MKKIVLILGIAALSLISCNKEPGEGGTSSIEGKLWIKDINGAGEIQAEYDGADEDVFILYGLEDQTYDEKFSTSLDGSFRFDYLTEGDYKVFAYSRCDTCASGMDVVQKTITISDKKTVYSVGTLEIYK